MLYEFNVSHNTTEATKISCCMKRDSIASRSFKKFLSGCKNLNDQTRSGRPKTVNSEAIAIEANLASCTWDISSKLGISYNPSSVIHHLHDHDKNIIKLLNCASY